MRKTLLGILLLALALAPKAWAQSNSDKAKALLDKAASVYENAAGVEANFTITQLQGKQEQSSTDGKILVSKGKAHVETDVALVWSDGTNLWTMQKGDTEVNLTTPTEEEKEGMNPYTYLRLYRQGYTCKTKKGSLSNGKQGHKIYMNTNDGSADIREAYIELDNSNALVRVSFRRGSDAWTRIVLGGISLKDNVSPSSFTFPSSEYPGVEVVDMRD